LTPELYADEKRSGERHHPKALKLAKYLGARTVSLAGADSLGDQLWLRHCPGDCRGGKNLPPISTGHANYNSRRRSWQ